MRVRSPGVNNWLFSHVITFVLPGHLWGPLLWLVDLKCLFLWKCICKSNAHAHMMPETHWNLPHGGRYARLTVFNIYLKGRNEVEKNNHFWKTWKLWDQDSSASNLTLGRMIHLCMSQLSLFWSRDLHKSFLWESMEGDKYVKDLGSTPEEVMNAGAEDTVSSLRSEEHQLTEL